MKHFFLIMDDKLCPSHEYFSILEINYGPWSKEEIRKLMHAVEEVMVKRARLENANSLSSSKKSHRSLQIDREKLFEKLPWTEIETKVGTRYWRQCKQKW